MWGEKNGSINDNGDYKDFISNETRYIMSEYVFNYDEFFGKFCFVLFCFVLDNGGINHRNIAINRFLPKNSPFIHLKYKKKMSSKRSNMIKIIISELN